MKKLGTSLVIAAAFFVLGSSPAAYAETADRNAAEALEKSLPSLVTEQKYRSASAAAFRLASLRNQMGDSAAACAALSQSLEYYRKALARDTGVREAAESSLDDDSDGMAEVRARFGCKRA